MMSGDVIILTGPPGAGKTTVAEFIASSATVPTVHLMTDAFYRAIRAGFVLPYRPEAQRQNEVVIDAIVAAVAAYAGGGYDVVVDGIVGPWFLPPFRALLKRDSASVSYIVLRPDIDTTLARALGRGSDELTAADAITGLHHQFQGLGDYEHHVLNNGDLDVPQTAVAVLRAVASRQHLLR